MLIEALVWKNSFKMNGNWLDLSKNMLVMQYAI